MWLCVSLLIFQCPGFLLIPPRPNLLPRPTSCACHSLLGPFPSALCPTSGWGTPGEALWGPRGGALGTPTAYHSPGGAASSSFHPFPQAPAPASPLTAAHCSCSSPLPGQPQLAGREPPPPHPPSPFPARLGGAGTKPEKGGVQGGDGGRWRSGGLQLLTLVKSPPRRPPSPLLGGAPVQPGERGSRGQRGQAQFNTQNKLIHSRGRQ